MAFSKQTAALLAAEALPKFTFEIIIDYWYIRKSISWVVSQFYVLGFGSWGVGDGAEPH